MIREIPWLPCLLLCFLLFYPVRGAGARESSVTRARIFLKSGEPALALDALRHARRAAAPDSALANLLAAEAYEKMGRSTAARAAALRAFRLSPAVSPVHEQARALWLRLSRAAARGKGNAGFSARLDLIAAAPAKSARRVEELAAAYAAAGQKDRAAALREVRNLFFPVPAPSKAAAHLTGFRKQLDTQIADKQWSQALLTLERAAGTRGGIVNSAVLLMAAGRVFRELRRPVGAWIAFDLAARTRKSGDPELPRRAITALATAFLDDRRPGLAAEVFEKTVLAESRNLTPKQRLVYARALRGSERFRDCLVACAPLLKSGKPSAETAEAWRLAGECHAALGQREQAWEFCRKAVEQAYNAGLRDRFAHSGRYAANRFALDAWDKLWPETARKIATAGEANGHPEMLADYYRDLLSRLEPGAGPKVRAEAAAAGRFFLEHGNPAEALPYFLAVLDCGGDRTFSKIFPPPLRENREFLAEVTTPPPPEVLRKALLGFSRCARSSSGKSAAVEAWPAERLDAWIAAWRATFRRGGDWEKTWRALLDAWPADAPERALTQFVLGQCLARAGRFGAAEKEFDAVLRAKFAPRPLFAAATLEKAVLLGDSLGEYERAAKLLGGMLGKNRCADLPPGVRDRARLKLAQWTECRGDYAGARKRFQQLAENAGDHELRLRARQALKRLDKAARMYPVASSPNGVVYLGEDRESRGDWKNRCGVDLFILCAIQCPGNAKGGKLWPVPYASGLGTQKKLDGAYYWSSDVSDNDPSALLTAYFNGSLFGNWDDGGEKRPIGAGPDLCWDLDIPKGVFRLSLYFVNDYNYYEPNRKWTLYLLDRDTSRFLAGCTVDHFLNGVYKQFIIAGPRKIRCRLWRERSMNALLSGVFLDLVKPDFHIPGYAAALEKAGPGAASAVRCLERLMQEFRKSPVRFVQDLPGLRRSSEPWLHGPAPACGPDDARAALLALAWRIGRLLRNEPRRVRAYASAWARYRARVRGKEVVEPEWRKREEILWKQGQYPAARTFAWARIALRGGLRGLPFEVLCRDFLPAPLLPVRYYSGKCFALAPDGSGRWKEAYRNAPRDFGFARTLILTWVEERWRRSPEKAPADVKAAIVRLSNTGQGYNNPWRALFSCIVEAARNYYWPGLRLPLDIEVRYAQSPGTRSKEFKRRWARLIRDRIKEFKDPVFPWRKYLRACRCALDAREARRAAARVLALSKDPKTRANVHLELAGMEYARNQFDAAEKELNLATKEDPAIEKDLLFICRRRRILERRTGIELGNVRVTPARIPADGKSTARAVATITVERNPGTKRFKRYVWKTDQPRTDSPGCRPVVWSIPGDDLGCTIDPDTGVVHAGTVPGNIRIRATDKEYPLFISGCRLTLEPVKKK